MTPRRTALLCVFTVAALTSYASPSAAGLLKRTPREPAAAVESRTDEIRLALDEQRYADASRLLDLASIDSSKAAELVLLSGELGLAQGRYADALVDFRAAEARPADRIDALQGQGLALSMLGQSDAALAILQKTVAEAPGAWRAWNALGGEYDRRREWDKAEAAYGHALENAKSPAVVLNNRGYSRLLQRRTDEAVEDLVAALQKKPDLAQAKTNLRLALAMKGDYRRATAAGPRDDQAALLNNAGFAASLAGDQAKAEELLDLAMKARGEFYLRASDNLTRARRAPTP